MDRAHILLVEDDIRLAELVSEYLTHHGLHVRHEPDGARAEARILEEQPDLVILDVMLPGVDGLTVCRRVRPRYDGAILMLTARGDEVDQVLGLELGADDYVAKPASPRLLLARVHALLRRRAPSSPRGKRLTCGDLVADRAARSVRLAGEPLDLTTAEFDLLWALMRRAGEPVTRQELFRELRGIDYDGYDRAMDVRVSQLRRKLFTDAGRPSRIKTVRGVGYQLVP